MSADLEHADPLVYEILQKVESYQASIHRK